MPPAQEMHMEVWDRFPRIGAVVDHQSKTAFRNAHFSGDLRSREDHPSQQFGVTVTGGGDPWNDPLGNDEDMRRGLRIDVVERNDLVRFMHNPGRDFTCGNFLKNGHARENETS